MGLIFTLVMKLAVWDCAGFKQQIMGVWITKYSAVVCNHIVNTNQISQLYTQCHTCTATGTVPFQPSVQSCVTITVNWTNAGFCEHLIRWIFESFGSSPAYLGKKNEYFWYLSWPKFHPWTLPDSVHKCHASHPMNTWLKWYSIRVSSYWPQLSSLPLKWSPNMQKNSPCILQLILPKTNQPVSNSRPSTDQ